MPEQLPQWYAVGVEPPASLKNSGWQPGMKPSAQHMNWLFNRAYKVLEELQTNKVDFDTHKKDIVAHASYAVNTSANDSYVVSIPDVTEYKEGMIVSFKATVANTTTCSLNINNLGAKTVYKYTTGLANLETGDIVANQIVSVIYNGSAFIVLSPLANTVTAHSSQTLTNKTLTAPKLANGGYIADANGNELIKGQTVASAANEFTVKNAATGNAPELQATGGDTNIDFVVVPKGTGVFKVGTKPVSLQEDVDNHKNNKNNPHNVTKEQVGLGSVEDYGIATQTEAEAGTSTAKYMTPQRTKQAIDKNLAPVQQQVTEHSDEFASPTKAGHIKVGNNLTIDGNGVLSANKDWEVISETTISSAVTSIDIANLSQYKFIRLSLYLKKGTAANISLKINDIATANAYGSYSISQNAYTTASSSRVGMIDPSADLKHVITASNEDFTYPRYLIAESDYITVTDLKVVKVSSLTTKINKITIFAESAALTVGSVVKLEVVK
ncbi:hypothetical protein [Lysinibacillus antri]|uniref:Uncharacterized protein n=1 Tax=Lysinibacillus antri TaxID=2498145 RepID=A0A432LHB1_9BACI|nr:hypothetical protein [Lysinibacillus antri]RUL56452.1 hypothetical protein EK386_02130 [Lysinibacillus antri]